MDPTSPRRSPEALASLIAVSITPLVGILLLGWKPAAVLMSYLVDTFVGFCVVIALTMIHVTGDEHDTPIQGWRRWSKLASGMVFLSALILIPLMLPLLGVLGSDVIVDTVLESSAFRAGIVLQVAMSVFAAWRAHRVLSATHDDERILAARFLFLTARWMLMFLAVAVGFVTALGPRFGSFALIAIYAGASIWFELYPEHAMRFARAGNPKPIVYQDDLEARAAKKRGSRPPSS